MPILEVRPHRTFWGTIWWDIFRDSILIGTYRRKTDAEDHRLLWRKSYASKYLGWKGWVNDKDLQEFSSPPGDRCSHPLNTII